MNYSIETIKGRQVWDSRGRPTVEAEIRLECGVTARAIAPAGASTGSGEALDRRDGGDAYGGMGISSALRSVNGEIAAVLTGEDVRSQARVDQLLIDLDGTSNKSRLGGNAIIAVSMAAMQAAATAKRQPLWAYLAAGSAVSIPVPEIQILGGGAHAGRRIDVQDFLIVCPNARNFTEVMLKTSDVYRAAGRMLQDSGKLMGVADEGGFWPAFSTNEEALEFLLRAIEVAGYAPGQDVHIALDVAATDFCSDGRYRLGLDQREIDSDELGRMLCDWVERYPIISIEDPFAENDLKAFKQFTAEVGHRVQIVGDDLLVTSADRVEQAAVEGLATCVLIKPNQAGTITETRAALDRAKSLGLGTIVSARSGESEDVTISHLSVGWNAGQFKVGSITRAERTAKWNEILRIEEALGSNAMFAGMKALSFNTAQATDLDGKNPEPRALDQGRPEGQADV
jgi:enolase